MQEKVQKSEPNRAAHIGSLIKELRTREEVKQEVLCFGLCSMSFLSDIESGAADPDKGLLDILFERLGVASNKYGCVFRRGEIKEVEWREGLLGLLRKGKLAEAGEYLELGEGREKGGDQGKAQTAAGYQGQFVEYVRLLIWSVQCNSEGDGAEKGRLEEGKLKQGRLEGERLEKAIFAALEYTLPGFRLENLEGYLLGRVERAILTLLADNLCRMGVGREEEGFRLFHRLLLHMEDHVRDREELVVQYPRVVALNVRRLVQYGRHSEVWICQKGISLLREERKCYELPALLRYVLCEWKSGAVGIPDGEDCAMSEEFLKIWDGLIGEYEEEWLGTEGEYLRCFADLVEQSTRGMVLGDMLQRMRREKNMTQKEISEGICTPKTVSWIENENSDPSHYVFGGLMEALGQECCRHYPFVKTNDIGLIDCERSVAKHIALQQFPQAAYELTRLELGLDMSDPVNRQRLEGLKVVVDGKMKGLGLEEQLQRLRAALALTLPPEVRVENWPLKENEVRLLNSIALCLEARGEMEEAVETLQAVKESCEGNRLGVERNPAPYLLTIYNLTGFLGRGGEYEAALGMAEKAIGLSLQAGYGFDLVEFLYIKAWNMEKICDRKELGEAAKKNTCLRVCRQAFVAACMMRYTRFREHIRKHYQEEYGIDI